jgi:hypothetical protein
MRFRSGSPERKGLRSLLRYKSDGVGILVVPIPEFDSVVPDLSRRLDRSKNRSSVKIISIQTDAFIGRSL